MPEQEYRQMGSAGYPAGGAGYAMGGAGYNGAAYNGAAMMNSGYNSVVGGAGYNGAVAGGPTTGAGGVTTTTSNVGVAGYNGPAAGPGAGAPVYIEEGAGAGSGACGDTCVAGGCVTSGEGSMAFVGAGQGDYVTQTTYRYVGMGAGDLAVVAPRTVMWGRIACVGVTLVGLAAVAYALATVPSPTTTPKPEIQQMNHEVEEVTGTCTFWGDPHLKTFDGSRPSFYGEGEFWIVKSENVAIQGRYMGTKYTAGLAATNKIIVGGRFMQGHTVAVGALEDGPILIDGMPVLTTQFPATRTIENVGKITYSAEGMLVDQATSEWDKKIVRMDLPHDVVVEVFRWSNYIDLRITMKKQEGQDGSCGNFNQDAGDDSTEAIFNRIGARVPQHELLFNERVTEQISRVEEELLAKCPAERRQEAQTECGTDLASAGGSETGAEMKSCMLDICYGSNEHTLRMAKDLGLVPAGSAADGTVSV